MGKTIQFIGDAIGKMPQQSYTKILGDLANKWDTDIVFCLCHGKYDVVPMELSFDKFYIFVGLLPKEFEGIKKSTIKSYKLDGKDMIFPVKADATQLCPQGDTLVYTSAPTNTEIIRDDDNVPMAAIYDSSLYILNDFIHCRSKEELDISIKQFNQIIDRAVNKTNVLKYLKAGVEEKSKRTLEKALKTQFSQRLDKEIIQLKAAKDTIVQYEKGIVEASRKAVATERIVEAIRKNISDVPAALEKTWKDLLKMNNSQSYQNISFTASGIKAITTPIFVEWQKKIYAMGTYEINLFFNGETKIYAVSNPIDANYAHPHISGGNPCWGNFAGYIPKLIGSSEFDVALVQIHTWLSHYDSGSPYKSIEHWPLAPEGEVKT